MMTTRLLALAVAGALAAGCVVGNIGDAGDGSGSGKGTSPSSALLPARIRRLTNAEFDGSVQALLGTTQTLGASFAPDTRQSGFTENAAARVDDVRAAQIDDAAHKLADEAGGHLSTLLPCDPAKDGEDACAKQFIATFGKRAYRRPLTADEQAALLAVYTAGHDGGAFADGIELAIVAMLESASFLYVTELGGGAANNGQVTLDPYETASALSYLFVGAPPDDALLAAADAGQLATPAQREAQARRLLADPRAKAQLRRLVEEWLGVDALTVTSKDANVYPGFMDVRPSMQKETDAFIDDVVFTGDAKLETLLTGNYSFVDAPLATFYGIPNVTGTTMQKVPLDGTHRRGILTQGSFLATWAHEAESAPVKRGVLVMRKLFCQDLTQPKNPPKPIIPPPPNASMTTRERFAQHATDSFCASCHDRIDGIGFTFEDFDGEGAYRATENGKSVDTSGSLGGTDVDGPLSDAIDLEQRLASSPAVKSCFARHVYRFASAQSDPSLEQRFVDLWNTVPAERQSNLLELLVAFAASDLFVTRSAP